jgi:hypothetical protein
MAYYIFQKSLRSLEEFRKTPHFKIPPKSPSTNFQSLGKFKKSNFNSEISFFLIFGPADPVARSASSPASPPAGRVFTENTFSLSVHAFLSRSPLPRLSDNWAPLGRCVFPTMPADPGRFLLTPTATSRRPTSDLVMPGKTITPHLDSLP